MFPNYEFFAGLHCSDGTDVLVGAGSTPTVIYANPPRQMTIRSRKSPAAEAASMFGPPTGPLPPIPSQNFANNQAMIEWRFIISRRV